MNIERKEWEGFSGRIWKEEVNVRDFIQHNYKPYDGDESFLAGPTEATNKLWGELQKLQKEERAKGGVLGHGNRSGIFSDSLWAWLHQGRTERSGKSCRTSDRQTR